MGDLQYFEMIFNEHALVCSRGFKDKITVSVSRYQYNTLYGDDRSLLVTIRVDVRLVCNGTEYIQTLDVDNVKTLRNNMNMVLDAISHFAERYAFVKDLKLVGYFDGASF